MTADGQASRIQFKSADRDPSEAPTIAATVSAAAGAARAAGVKLVRAVLGGQVRARGDAEPAGLAAQREAIARDLHDGLAQDLALIAFHGQRLEAELGPGHPLSVATRRALATSRQTIVDLAASHAPTTVAALREVADELQDTLGIEIAVHDEVHRPAGPEPDLRARAREHFVRTAREAIVNAARHGRADHVDVTLANRGPGWLLTIADDGSGIPDSQLACPSGFGMQAIRSRAEELGGRLSTGRGAAGGTVVELSTAGSPATAAGSRHTGGRARRPAPAPGPPPPGAQPAAGPSGPVAGSPVPPPDGVRRAIAASS